MRAGGGPYGRIRLGLFIYLLEGGPRYRRRRGREGEGRGERGRGEAPACGFSSGTSCMSYPLLGLSGFFVRLFSRFGRGWGSSVRALSEGCECDLGDFFFFMDFSFFGGGGIKREVGRQTGTNDLEFVGCRELCCHCTFLYLVFFFFLSVRIFCNICLVWPDRVGRIGLDWDFAMVVRQRYLFLPRLCSSLSG